MRRTSQLLSNSIGLKNDYIDLSHVLSIHNFNQVQTNLQNEIQLEESIEL